MRLVGEPKLGIVSSLVVKRDGFHAEVLLDQLNCILIYFRLQYLSLIGTLNQSLSIFLR